MLRRVVPPDRCATVAGVRNGGAACGRIAGAFHHDRQETTMCMCGKPTINGEPGYSWDGKSIGVRPVDPPALADGDVLVYDGPGRCGGLDCHSHHFRLVMDSGRAFLLVQHGGGDERIQLGSVHRTAMAHGLWDALDENQ